MASENNLVIPPNFKQMIVECVDPTQSCDYMKLGTRTFRIQVPTIGLEKKILRLVSPDLEKFDYQVIRSVGEILSNYESCNMLDWPEENARMEELADFYHKVITKILYNDEVIKVVNQVQLLIDWRPVDEKIKEESKRYVQSQIFLPIMMLMHVNEQMTPDYITKNLTRAMLEIYKLNNMISNDRMAAVGEGTKKQDLVSQRMNKAETFEEYSKGLSDQGFSLADLF